MTDYDSLINQLDDLCRQRANTFPLRGEVHAALSAKIDEFRQWLTDHSPPDWQPNPALLAKAENLTPLLIGGFYKSGTTFMLNLLDSHPAVSALPGDAKLLRFYDQIQGQASNRQLEQLKQRWFHTLINPTGLPPFFLFGKTAEPYQDFLQYLTYWFENTDHPERRTVDAVSRAYYAANPFRPINARYWIDKTPTQEDYLDRWLALYPSARFIYIVRNPLAVIAAMQTIAHERGQDFRIDQTVNNLRRSMHLGRWQQEKLREDQYIIVRYEDVITDHETIMHRLAEWLTIDYHPALLKPTINGRASTSNTAYKENRRQGTIQTNSLDRWRERLSPGDINWIVSSLYKEAAYYGYNWDNLYPRNAAQYRFKQQLKTATHSIERLSTRLKQAVIHRLKMGTGKRKKQ